jgi:hypothetical protein
VSFPCTQGTNFPCVFAVMLGMTTHSENKWRVRRELLDILLDAHYGEGLKYVRLDSFLDYIVKEIKKIEGSSKRLKQLYEKVRAIIQDVPDDYKFKEEKWVAAYIYYLNSNKFERMLHEIDEIDRKIIALEDSLDLSDDLCFDEEELEEIRKLESKKAAIFSEMNLNLRNRMMLVSGASAPLFCFPSFDKSQSRN